MGTNGAGYERNASTLQHVVEVSEAAIVEALELLFEDVPASIEQSEVGTEAPPESTIASVIILSGQVSGLISLHASRALASHIGQALLQAEASEELSDPEVYDAFGELCNVLAGNIKTRCLEKLELTMNIGVPTVIIPKDGIAVPPPRPDVASAIIHAKVAFCPLTLYLCIDVVSDPKVETSV